ncbi:MAG: FecR domain-containing protein [Kangiellaceae bacterium]|nr:FecR domain-containing protein [Kangiellaceae bacterium]
MKKILVWFLVALTLWLGALSSVLAEDWIYTVRRGDTIWGLSHKYLKEPLKFKEIQDYNQVTFDRQIPPGTILKFPLEYLKFGPAEVSVIAIQGQASFIRRQQTSTLTLQQSLTVDDVVVTSADSSVALRFADGSELLLGENSELIFDVQTQYGETGMVDSRMRLNKGSAEGRVKKLIGPGSHFEVHTPSAVATVRGTEFRVRVDAADNSVVFNEVSEGKVAVNLEQDSKLVNQGFGLRASKNQPLVEPKPLLAKPILSGVLDSYPGHPVILDWDLIDGAVSYQVEIFSDSNLTRLTQKFDTADHQLQLPLIEPDTYYARIKGIDSEAYQGLAAVQKFTIAKVLAVPKNIDLEEQIESDQTLEVSWQAVPQATSYQWQVAADSEFNQILTHGEVNEPFVSIDNLQQQPLYFRVAAKGPYQELAYSQGKPFEVVEADNGKTKFSLASVLLFILLL